MSDPTPSRSRFLWNVVWKGLLLFLIANLLFATFPPHMGRVSAYNHLFPGRDRFPFGENQQASYNLSMYDLDAMFRSLKLAEPKGENEYRIVVIGDSSIWGTLLQPDQTLAARISAFLGNGCEGRAVRVYNLGYPTLSLTKDLMVIDQALAYQPDLIIWPMTLESFPKSQQLASPIAANNEARLRDLRQKYGVELFLDEPPRSVWSQTIIGQRRALADWLRLQAYGVMWAATGIDQFYPKTYTPAARDLEDDNTFSGWEPPDLPADQMALDVLAAGIRAAGDTNVPLILVNEPILISKGANSDIRYNFYYPRWAYDQYRQILTGITGPLGLEYYDLWNLVPEKEFTNSAIHLTTSGVDLMAEALMPAVQAHACRPAGEPEPTRSTPAPSESGTLGVEQSPTAGPSPTLGTPEPTQVPNTTVTPGTQTPDQGYPGEPVTTPSSGDEGYPGAVPGPVGTQIPYP